MSKTPAVLYLAKGATVTRGDREYVILHLVDLNSVLAREVSSGEKVILRLDELGEPAPATTADGEKEPHRPTERDLLDISDDDWAVAEIWREKIGPLLSQQRPTRAYYVEAAAELAVSVATLYRRVANYKNSGLLSAFLPTRRPGGQGKARLPDDVELIIKDRIEHFYLTDQKPTIEATTKEIRRLCSNAGLSLPSLNTVRLRIQWLDEKQRVKKRDGTKAARRFTPLKSPIPDASWPLALVQIDHTKMPVMIVDDEHRRPIARAWVTFAIDAFSRVCLGMYLSLDPPSAMSAGLCLAHAILMKDPWLRRLGLGDIEWPFFGVMDVLHMDNAREFRGAMLKVACHEYDIDIHLRPVKQPHYGAYIERLMGTVTERLKSVKGATFSGPTEKGEYDAEGNACMTLDELEKWLVLMFAQYHRDVHTGIGTTPMAKWREGIVGTKAQRGRGLPVLRLDAEKLRIDFMPFEERGVYDYGVVIDEVHYFHDVLRPWMNSKDPDHPRHGRKFRFRRDPRDISELYFFDPDLKRYFAIPYRDTSLPPASIWELRAARLMANERGVDTTNEREVFALLTRQRELEAESARKTKSARHAQQQRKHQAKAKQEKAQDLPAVSRTAPSSPPEVLKGYDPSKVRPLDDDY